MGGMKGLLQFNKAIVFFMELGMLAAMSYWGFHTHAGVSAWLWGLGLPLVAIILWGVWAAPKAKRRLAMPYLAVFVGVLFGLAAFLLYQAGQVGYAIAFFIVAETSMLIGYLTD